MAQLVNDGNGGEPMARPAMSICSMAPPGDRAGPGIDASQCFVPRSAPEERCRSSRCRWRRLKVCPLDDIGHRDEFCAVKAAPWFVTNRWNALVVHLGIGRRPSGLFDADIDRILVTGGTSTQPHCCRRWMSMPADPSDGDPARSS